MAPEAMGSQNRPAPPVAVVVVSYQSASTIDVCLAALRMQAGIVEIRVVDNGSTDDSVAKAKAVAATDLRVAVLGLDGNPGFAAGCNAGAAATTAPWLLFVNPDLELSEGAVAKLLAHAAARPGLGALGADLRNPTGERDPAARRQDLSIARLLGRGGGRHALDVEVDESRVLQTVEACSGALMLVPRRVFDAVGGFDAGYRLHVEDLDFCRRLRAAGFIIAVANDVPVLHHRGVSSRSRPFFVEWHKHRGLWRYWWRFEARGLARLAAPVVFGLLALRLFALAWPKVAFQVAKTRVG